jgi:hypothetical protein
MSVSWAKKLLPSSSLKQPHRPFRGRGLCVTREREAALSGGGEPLAERACVRRMPVLKRAVYLAHQTDCLPSAFREQCLAPGITGNRARRVSAVCRLLPPPSSVVERKPILLGPMRWVDVAGRALRRTWTAHWRRQYVEVLELADRPQSVSPPPRPPRAVRQASPLELARPACAQRLVGTTAPAHHRRWRSRFSRHTLTKWSLSFFGRIRRYGCSCALCKSILPF